MLITIGLIWLWLIDLAHSSILSTFLADLELSWIDCDLSSEAASLPESPALQSPHFIPESPRGWAAVCAGAWLPDHDLTLVAIVIRRGQWARQGVVRDDIGVMRREESEYDQYLGNNERGLGTLRGKVRTQIGRGLGWGKNCLRQGDVMSLISHRARCLGSDDLLSFFVNKKPAWNECLLIQTKY